MFRAESDFLDGLGDELLTVATDGDGLAVLPIRDAPEVVARLPMTVDAAATTLAMLADVRVGLALIDDHAFTLDDVEAWIGTTTTRALLLHDRPR